MSIQRVLSVANAVLFVVLAALVVRHGRVTAPDSKSLEWTEEKLLPPDAVRLTQLAFDGAERFIVDFGTDMVAAAEIDEPAPLSLVRLEPDTAVGVRWVSARALEVVPRQGFRRATEYRVLFDPALVSLDGRFLPKDLALAFSTEPLRLRHVAVTDDEPPALLVSFNMPVATDALRKAAALATPDGAPLALTVDRFPGERATHRIALAAPAAADRLVLRLSGSLVPESGALGLGDDVVREVALAAPLRLVSAEAEANGIDLEFSRAVALPAKGLVALDPPREFQVAKTGRGLRLIGDFAPGSTLAVTLEKGFPGSGRAPLAEPLRRSCRVADLAPALRFAQEGRVLSSRARPEIRVAGANVDEIVVSVKTVYPNNVVRLAQERYDLPESLFAPPIVRRIAVAASRNERFERPIDLAEILGGRLRGVHLVSVRDPAWRGGGDSRLVQITDLGVTVRAAPGALALRVVSLATGEPVDAASVRVFTPTNQELVSGRTDVSGVAVLRYQDVAADRQPFAVEVRRGDDVTFVDRDGFRVELAADAFGGAPHLRASELEAFVAPDRGILRPGEELRATVLARDARARAPEGGARLEARWYGPNRRLRRKEPLALDASGLAVARLATALDSPVGAWRLDVALAEDGDRVIGSANFRVEAFVPDRLEAAIDAAAPLFFGETGEAVVAARWLDGTPAAGLPAKVFVRFDHETFAPPLFDGEFAFGAAEDLSPPGAVPPVVTALDANGSARVRFAVPAAAPGVAALKATLVCEVEDPSGRPAVGSKSVTALRAGGHVGVRATREGASVALAAADGTPRREALPVTVRVERRSYALELRARGGDRVGYESRVRSTPIAEFRESTSEDGRLEIRFPAPLEEGSGWLVVVAEAIGARSERAIGAVPGRPDKLRVQSLGGPVKPGESARIAIDAPFSGSALVTLEGAGLHGVRVASVAKGRTVVDVPVPADLAAPNVHAVVTLVSPQAAPNAAGLFWLTNGVLVRLDHPERKIAVALEAPAGVLPESAVTIRLRAPGAATAVVALVDEGILRRTAHADPDPAAYFARQRRLDSLGFDTGVSLMDGARFESGILAGGDGGDELEGLGLDAGIAETIRPVALFEGPIALDADGAAEIAFALPPFEGRLRAMAVVSGIGGTGAARADVTVSGPLSLLVAGPRVLAPGDETEIVVTVRNASGGAGEVLLEIDPAGGLAPLSDVPSRFALRDGERRSLRLRARAGAVAGTQGIRCVARLGDAVREALFEVGVREVRERARERTGFVAQGETRLDVPAGFLEDGLSARLVLHASADAQLAPAIESLVEYPHGCAEQTTSRGMALLAARPLLARLYPDGGAPDADALVAAAFERLLAMQTDRGGIAMWPGGYDEDRFVSVYALDFFVAAREAGIEVPGDAVAALAERVARILDREDGVSLRAYAAETLSRAGRPVAAAIAQLASVVASREDRARVALALARSGDRAWAAEVLEGGGGGDETLPPDRGGLHRSGVRTRALELRARLLATPASPRVAEIASRLMADARTPSRLTTQECAQVVGALDAYFAAHAPETSAIRATVFVDGEAIEIGKAGAIPLE